MKAMFFAFLCIAIIAVGANQILMRAGFDAGERFAGPSVRLD